jgi:RNA polymerase sigma factor (sigma-70 family)
MTAVTRSVTRRQLSSMLLPSFVSHPDFERKSARREFDPVAALETPVNYDSTYMPDDVTRDYSRRMHYAAYRMHTARTDEVRETWQKHYFALRDQIVVGNRKLIFRAVRRHSSLTNYADDVIGDCHIVLIQVVAAYNPWLGIRFSTYAYTCLVRAMSRQAKRVSFNWFLRAVSLDAFPDGEVNPPDVSDSTRSLAILDEFFRDDHPLLTSREKSILRMRFSLNDDQEGETLEDVGEAMGLSKERVRQVQLSAIEKLRTALTPSPVAC